MDELKLLQYQFESNNKVMLKIIQDINDRLNRIEYDVKILNGTVESVKSNFDEDDDESDDIAE